MRTRKPRPRDIVMFVVITICFLGAFSALMRGRLATGLVLTAVLLLMGVVMAVWSARERRQPRDR